MNRLFRFSLVILLWFTTLFPVFTGDSKGILVQYGLLEIGLIDRVFSSTIDLWDFLILIFMLVIQFSILTLLKFFTYKNTFLIPAIFIIGYLLLNFYDFNFKDSDKAFIALIPFLVVWITTIIYSKKFNNP